MSRFLLDTNIIIHILRSDAGSPLLRWMTERLDEELFISTVTVAELWRGVLQTPQGKRRRSVEAWFNGPQGPLAAFGGRILEFDYASALIWGNLMHEGRTQGRPRSAMDMLIASIAAANACVVVTQNERDFLGVEFINPAR